MSVLRYIAAGRLPQPKFFLQYQGRRAWLWEEREFQLAHRMARLVSQFRT
jgi:hypothetical protein